MVEKGGQVSKVVRERVVACMTCPLCNKLFEEATTISECLHTFCKKCIHDKITVDGIRTCPVCNIYLGQYSQLEKLRPDNNLQDIRIKIFPFKGKKSRQPKGMPLVQTHARRKERSLSSLVVSTPRVLEKSGLTGRRTKLIAKKSITNQESSSSIKKHISNQEDLPQILSSPDTNRKDFSVEESSKQHLLDKRSESTEKALEKDKADLCKPLICLVEASGKTKHNKVNTQGSIGKPASCADDYGKNPPTNVKESCDGLNVHVPSKENVSTPELSTSIRTRRSSRKKNKPVSERLSSNIPAQAVVDSRNKYDGRFGPIWFSLVASDVQEGGARLPQISSRYIRVKDGNLPVSSIKKYLVKKLGLSCETEVEISLRGQPLLSTLQLHNLVHWWAQTTPASERLHAFVGSSAKDFVMVLSYSLKESTFK